jgi:mannose-6-phosphate isomerase-like protein (cupin superfamily)
MNGKIRRVVTGHDANGKAIVLEDRLAPNVRTNALRPGHISVELWKTTSSPVPIAREEPDPTEGPKVQIPGPNGTVFRISEIAPETDAIHSIDAAQAKEVFKAMGNEAGSTFGDNQRHPFMHRTKTVDYAVVLEGEVTMLLDDGEVHLKQGDVVIQRGTNHAWSNRSNKPVKMLYVLIDAEFDEELKSKSGGRSH